MSHPAKRIVVSHNDIQWVFDSSYAVLANQSWATFGTKVGYDEVADLAYSAIPDTSPVGARSLDPDSLEQISSNTYPGSNSNGVDAHGGNLLVWRSSSTSPATLFTLDVLDNKTLAVKSSTDVPTSIFAPFTVGNPNFAVLPMTSTPQYVASMGNGSSFKIMSGASVVGTINPPDPSYPIAYSCSSDTQGRLITTWISSLAQHKLVVYDTDLSTILCSYKPAYTVGGTTYTQQARFKGSTYFDPDGETFWYYSGIFHIDLFSTPTEPYPKLYRYSLQGNSTPDRFELDLFNASSGPLPGAAPIDSGAYILVYGPDGISAANSRFEEANFYQRFTASSG